MKIIKTLTIYLKSSIEELKKVAWPTKAETFRYSALVIGISLAIALAVGILDFALTLGLEELIKIRPAPTVDVKAQPINTQSTPIKIDPSDIQVETVPTTK